MISRGLILLLTLTLSTLNGCSDTSFSGDNAKKPEPKPQPAPATQQPEAEAVAQPAQIVEFGDDKVFHIGDGQFTASSCKTTIEENDLSGNKFFFEFEVLTDGTDVDVSIQTICGIDTATNILTLQKGSEVIQNITLQKAQTSVTLPKQKLSPGKYAVIVESKATGPEILGIADHDDFVVGKVRIQASAKITPIGVRAE